VDLPEPEPDALDPPDQTRDGLLRRAPRKSRLGAVIAIVVEIVRTI